MARPIRETPVLKGEDAFNFEMRRLEVESMSKEQRAENLRKLEEPTFPPSPSTRRTGFSTLRRRTRTSTHD